MTGAAELPRNGKANALGGTRSGDQPQISQLPNGIDLSNSVGNKYLFPNLLQAFGVPVAQAQITDFGERHTLIVERFDRLWGRDGRPLRLPQENICQALSVQPTQVPVGCRSGHSRNFRDLEG